MAVVPTPATGPVVGARLRRCQLAAVATPAGSSAKLNSFLQIRVSASQANALSTYLTDRYQAAADLILGYKAILDALQFDPEAAEDFEAAFDLLAEHLGFKSHRPDHDRGEGPDNLWSLGDLSYWVVEAKSGATTELTSKHYVNQLAGSLNWFRDNYDADVKSTLVMIHPSTQLASNANAPEGMCVIDDEKLTKFKAAVMGLAEGLALQTAWTRPSDVNGLLTGHHLRAKDLSVYLKRARPS